MNSVRVFDFKANTAICKPFVPKHTEIQKRRLPNPFPISVGAAKGLRVPETKIHGQIFTDQTKAFSVSVSISLQSL